MYSNASIKDIIRKNCVEFCELIEPKRESIVIEFEEDQSDDTYQQINEETINLPNGTFDEAENDQYQANSNINNGASIELPPIVDVSNTAIIDADHIEKDTVSGNTSIVTNVKHSTSQHPVGKIDASNELSRRTDVIECKSNNFNTDIPFSNNPEQVADIVTSAIPNDTEINELTSKHMIENRTAIVESSAVSGMIINGDTNEINQRSPKRSQLRKLSVNNGINEVGKEVRKPNGTADDLKDEGNNRSNIPQR